MNRKSVPLTWFVILSSFVLYACIGLIPLEEEIPVTPPTRHTFLHLNEAWRIEQTLKND
jgi:hypothetical protein